MSDVLIAVIAFAVIFGGALIGKFLGRIVPTQHLTPEARDVIRIVMTSLATLSAVVLGLLTTSAISSLAEKEAEFRNAGVQFVVLDRTLAAYGPETKDTRDLLKRVLAERISQIWPQTGGDVELGALESGPGIGVVQENIFALSPQTEQQKWLRDYALDTTKIVGESRWRIIEQIDSRFPWPFLAVVVFWLGVVFGSLSLFAPRSPAVTGALLFAALGLSGAMFMILEMDQPYNGVVKIPSTSLQTALDQLGRS